MTDKIFMAWIQIRLTPAFKKMFGENEKMILQLDNATYHHVYNEKALSPKVNPVV